MNKSRKTSHILNVFQYDETTGAVTLPSTLSLTAPSAGDNSSKVATTAWARTFVTSLSYLTSGTTTTSDIGEGTNLYYTQSRFNTAFGLKTTTDLTEGTNLYYTDSRVGTYLTSNSYATQSYVGTQLANLVAAAPATLDTLNELAAALGNDPSFATTVTTSIGTKVPQARTLTINGTTYDLSANRSWTITSMIYPNAGIALSTGTGWGASIIDNSANWNTAYGWGNHTSAGYLPSSIAATTYVSLTGSYTNPSWITSLAYSKITGVPAFLTSYTETDPYRVTAVAVSGTSTKTITITRADASTVTTTWTDIDTDTNTYVTSAGFSGGTLTLTRNDAGTVSVSLDGRYYLASNPSGYITGITSSMVTTALGYTPYNSTNPNGYITGITSSQVTTALGYTPYNSTNPAGYITGISFANVSSKPTTLDGYGITDAVPSSRTITINGTALDLSANRSWTITATETDTLATVMARGASTSSGITFTASGGTILLKHAVSEVDAWIFQENAANWGIYWKNAPSGHHTFGGYTTIGAETFGMSAANASGNGILTSNFVGATSAYAQWMLSNYTGYIWSASTIFAAGDMRAPIYYDSNDTAYYLNPAGGSRLRNLYVGDSGDDWSDPGGWGTQVRFSNGPHVKFVLHARTPGIEAGMYVHTPGSVFIGSFTSHDVSMMRGGSRRLLIEDGRIYSDVYMEAAGSMRAPIFYDSNDTGYYLDPNGTSNLYKFSEFTMAYNSMNPMSVNSPYAARYAGSANYRNGTMGNGSTDFNVMFSNWGSGFIDSWSSPANAPGGSSHYVGLQGFHYNHQNSSQAYGFQMACAGEADNRFFWRSAWPNLRGWVEMIHSGNIGSQKANGALKLWAESHPNDYYIVNNWTGSYWRLTTNHGSGVQVAYADSAGNASTLGGYSGSNWLGKNGNSYYQADTWIQCNGYHGLYAPSWNGAHFYPNNSSYGAWRVEGSRNGWNGIHFGGGTGMTLMMNETEFGFHREAHGWYARFTNGRFYGASDNVYNLDYALGNTHYWTAINYFQTNNGGQAVNNSNSAKLEAYSTGNNSAFMSFHKGGHYAINMGLDDDNVFRIGGWSASGNRLQLDMSGNLTVAGDVTAYSDARVKENIITVDNALTKVLSLRGVYYNRIDSDDKKTKIGVIAQETLPIVPEVVNQDNDGMFNVSYGNLAGLFIEAIKEQQKEIEELKTIIYGLTR